jgi:hypothetical protein
MLLVSFIGFARETWERGMNSPYMRVAIAASAVVGLLLAGSATAAAAPDSSGNKGGGKPSPAASGNSGGNSQGNSKGNSPGNSSSGGQGNSQGNSQGNKPANPGNSQGNSASNSQGNSAGNSQGNSASNSQGNSASNSPGNSAGNSQGNSANSGSKTLPDTASPVAQAAVNKDKTATPVSPTTAPPVDDVAEKVTPTPESPAENTATPPAATPQSNRDAAAAGPASPARPATSPTPGAPSLPAVDGADSLGAPATAAWAVPLSPSGATPDADDSVAAGVGKWLGDAATTIAREVREALREVTLKDLALAALPGIAGLLFFLATGVGLGHRQARFSFALETSGARLAPRGPLGLVGSGSLVRMRSTAPTRRRTLRLVDRAA